MNRPVPFISYSNLDQGTALRLKRLLEENGFTTWLDRENLIAGQQWPTKIGEAIAVRDGVLLLWSANSAMAHFVKFEWNVALAMEKVIIPCLLDTTPLPPALRPIHAINCQDLDAAIPEILRAFENLQETSNPELNLQIVAELREINVSEPEQIVEEALNKAVAMRERQQRPKLPWFPIGAILLVLSILLIVWLPSKKEEEENPPPTPEPLGAVKLLEILPRGSQAQVQGRVENIPADAKVGVYGRPVQNRNWQYLGQAMISDSSWTMEIPIRLAYEPARQFEVIAVVSRNDLPKEYEEGSLPANGISNILSGKPLSPQVLVTLINNQFVQNGGRCQIVPRRTARIEGLASNLLNDETILVVIFGLNASGNDIERLRQTTQVASDGRWLVNITLTDRLTRSIEIFALVSPDGQQQSRPQTKPVICTAR